MATDHLVDTVAELIESLESAADLTGRGRAIRKPFKIAGTNKNLISWKFNEWDYGKSKIQLPSHARGLFTLEGEPRIVVRGYDKFFNIDETPMTKWSWLEENTHGPYHVTSKENGCIILISALKDGAIIVCSKHSYGSRDDVNRNHAKAGEEALVSQLHSVGISLKEFALKLYEMNVTAIAELCDDEFEEHVIEYTRDQAGLYLHGLNLNKPIFETYPIDKVESFAKAYGFKTVDYFQEDEISKLKEILSGCAKTGSFNGKETEGFVIRCKMKNPIKGTGDYFFKFKFEEPYLMYRQWREVTRTYITRRLRGEIRFNKHKYITNKYLDFIIPILDSDTQICERFIEGHGIIDLRKRFLENFGMTASEIINSDKIKEFEAINSLDDMKIDEHTKFILVPVATIGCGKTTVGMTLTDMFQDWSIVNNDDVPNGKNGPTEFVKRGLEHLQKKRAVVMDRNNHQFRERQQIFDTVKRLRDQYLSYDVNIQFVALNFIGNETDADQLWKLTTRRVKARGDNHQSIKAQTDGELVHKIMSGFIKRFQPLTASKEPDSRFDYVIDFQVDSENSSLENIKLVLKRLHGEYPVLIPNIPSDAQIESSFKRALDFKPTFTKFGPKTKKQKNQADAPCESILKERLPVYFSLDVQNKSEFLFCVESLVGEDDGCLYWKLRANSRIQDEFHITTAHVTQGKKGGASERVIWKQYLEIYDNSKGGSDYLDVTADIRLSKLIWDDKALAAIVDDVKFYNKSTKEPVKCSIANKFPHITIGTACAEIKPFYSNALAQKAADGDQSVTVVPWTEKVVLQYVPLKVNF
jgi:tRNA ligase